MQSNSHSLEDKEMPSHCVKVVVDKLSHGFAGEQSF